MLTSLANPSPPKKKKKILKSPRLLSQKVCSLQGPCLIADKVSENPLVVKLKFEPSGRPKSERNYYLQLKENMCVVCGTTEGYARKFIVPQEYRK